MTMQATAPKANIINGVDIDALSGTIDAIKGQPAIATFKFQAKNRWIDGGLNRSEIAKFCGACQEHAHMQPFVLDNDEPPVLLSKDTAPNPVEYVLHALAGCLTTSLVYHAAARGISIDEVESKLEGDLDLHGFLGLDENVRNGYQQIRVSFKIKGGLTEAQKDELAKIAQKYSPVFDIVSNEAPVEVEVGHT
jgi:uncharacterized OsmC-like protein